MAESKKITITPSDVDKIIKEYREQRAAASQITVEFSGVNNLDTLLLLRIMEKKEPTVDDIAHAAEIMLDGQTITFKNGEETVFALAYNRGTGNALHLMFDNDAALYDILQQAVYALMLKKLTPHLVGSN